MFEHIEIDSSGKRGEMVYCKVWVSPVRGHRLYFKPSPEVDEFLTELVDPAAGCTFIESHSAAIAWELRVAQVAPERVRALALVHAPQLALQTGAAREAALKYARRIREISDEAVMEYLVCELSRRARPDQLRQADRFQAGGTRYDVIDASRCAAIAVAMFGPEMDAEHGGFADEPASKSCELKLRLNIAADILRLGVQ
ncbi:hypothetical protein AYO47_07600 [Planctomyces sp. SCGC AG-212-M04]|nr:hypothetical protein AYO47_07600 [Planctomyces sp. SCGC AG-212-M04]